MGIFIDADPDTFAEIKIEKVLVKPLNMIWYEVYFDTLKITLNEDQFKKLKHEVNGVK